MLLLPKLDFVPLRVHDPCEFPIFPKNGFADELHVFCPQFHQKTFEVADAQVDHKRLFARREIRRVIFEKTQICVALLYVVVAEKKLRPPRFERDFECFLIKTAGFFDVFAAQKDAAEAEDMGHGN